MSERHTSPVGRLAPFFSYYGSKHRGIGNYPPPSVGRIKEPFAGSAAYATKYYHLPVTLYDANPKIAGVWDYLIRASRWEIARLPVNVEGDTADLTVPQEAQWLIGFWLCRARAHPARTASAWHRQGGTVACGQYWGESTRTRLAAQVERIRHWRVECADYLSIDASGTADWFVDPPYEGRAGLQYRRYGSANVDYEHLSAWCRKLQGAVTVCESVGASWLNFRPLFTNQGLRGAKVEGVWLSGSHLPLLAEPPE